MLLIELVLPVLFGRRPRCREAARVGGVGEGKSEGVARRCVGAGFMERQEVLDAEERSTERSYK
jgi:hypothetical protein